MFLEKIRGRDSVQILTRVGGRLPLHATGVGKVLLAHPPAEVIEAVIARGPEPLTPRTIATPTTSHPSLDTICSRVQSALRALSCAIGCEAVNGLRE